jgi:hypothetical protein
MLKPSLYLPERSYAYPTHPTRLPRRRRLAVLLRDAALSLAADADPADRSDPLRADRDHADPVGIRHGRRRSATTAYLRSDT